MGTQNFPLSHARDKTKNIFMELKTYTLFTLGLYTFGNKEANRVDKWVGEKLAKDMSRLS